jgi:predicted lipid-binding transport protein (Tim44 family)
MGGGVAPSTGNVMQITSTLRGMSDQQLQQYAAMHKSDPFVFPLAFQESQTRKQMRVGQAAQMAGQNAKSQSGLLGGLLGGVATGGLSLLGGQSLEKAAKAIIDSPLPNEFADMLIRGQ